MRSIDRPDAGGGHRVVAEILGTQIAWWQLGFGARRAVVRAARRGIRFPDPDVRRVAVDWAWQWLAAPRWWRIMRDGGATVLAVVCVTALVTVLAAADGLVAVSGAAIACLPLTVWWLRRQTRHARLLVGTAPAPQRVPARGLAVRALAALLAAGTAATTLVAAITYEDSILAACPRFTIDTQVRDWWERDMTGCPAGDSRTGAAGLRYTPWTARERLTGRTLDQVVYIAPDDHVFLLPVAIFDAWTARGGPAGWLGLPVDSGNDGAVSYVNLRGGAIVLRKDGTLTVHSGRTYSFARDVDSACVPRDRPCVVTAYADADGVHLGWQYGAADAFNVSWRPLDDSAPATDREVAGYTVTLPGLRRSTVYVVDVAACRKRFLRRSVCTWPSAPVTVRVG